MSVDLILGRSIFPVGVVFAFRPKETQLLFQRFLCACFYKYLFGKRTPLATRLAEKVASWEKRQGRGDIPIPQEAWESQYVEAQWSYLDQLEELGRYSVIAGYIQCLNRQGSILDIGCGEGILVQRLSSAAYERYVGIDLSQTAIDNAAKKANNRVVFVQADAETFSPGESFDVIILNEVLYYLDQPLEVIQRYESWLKPGGVFVTSLYENSTRALAISRCLKERYQSMAEVKMSTRSVAWMIDMFAPKTSSVDIRFHRDS